LYSILGFLTDSKVIGLGDMAIVPRPIVGRLGGRIRLVFGDNGKEWLILIDHDNGDSKWQLKDWKGIPHAVAKQLNTCTEKGRDIKAVDFGPDEAWYINGVKSDGSGNHSWWGDTDAGDTIEKWISLPHSVQGSFGTNYSGSEEYVVVQGNNGYAVSNNLNSNLVERLKEINARKKKINFVRLFHNGQYFISDDEGEQWLLKDTNLVGAIKNNEVKEVAVAGDGSWVVIHENKYVSSVGVDEELDKKLSKFFYDQSRWSNERRQEIRDAIAANERERVAERAVWEAAEAAAEEERDERERLQQEAREAVEQEAREEAERVERETRDAAIVSAAAPISSLVAIFEQRLVEEAEDIKEMEAKLRKRKQLFRDTMILLKKLQTQIVPIVHA